MDIRFRRARRVPGPLVTLIFAGSLLASGQKEMSVHSFRINGTDGFDPIAGLVVDGLGNLYGATYAGGSNFKGAVFELSPPFNGNGIWSESILYSFGAAGNGSYPGSGPLVFDKSGNLYGTASTGGISGKRCPTAGCGIVFELSPPTFQSGAWSYMVLFKFSSSTGPALNGVIADEAGNLYGTAPSGGSAGVGAVIKLLRPAVLGGAWTAETIYSFTGGSDGAGPLAGVALGRNRELYGTTQGGGPTGVGTVFELTPPSEHETAWTHTVLYRFVGGNNDGSGVNAGVTLDPQGNLYGTTVGGGPSGAGVVFRLSPPVLAGNPWTETILHTFLSSDGAFPYDAPVLDRAGNLYGTTSQGGAHNVGTVFKLAPSLQLGGAWIFSTLHDFNGGSLGDNEGAFPWAGLIPGSGGILYGTTTEGGIGDCLTDIYYGCGTVFKVTN